MPDFQAFPLKQGKQNRFRAGLASANVLTISVEICQVRQRSQRGGVHGKELPFPLFQTQYLRKCRQDKGHAYLSLAVNREIHKISPSSRISGCETQAKQRATARQRSIRRASILT